LASERINPDTLFTNKLAALDRATRNNCSSLPIHLRMSGEGSETPKAATRAIKKLAKKYDILNLLNKPKVKSESVSDIASGDDTMNH
jgi:hypothetical protein